MQRQPGRILLAEDDTVDARAFRRALGRLGVDCPLEVARDGTEAWRQLSDPAGGWADGDSLVVLDINMPRVSGLELLAQMRADARLREAVVFIMTTSENETDRLRACDLNVAGYIFKSDLQTGLAKALGLMGDHATARDWRGEWTWSPRA
jgi:CheY-like chemotaxis protein